MIFPGKIKETEAAYQLRCAHMRGQERIRPKFVFFGRYPIINMPGSSLRRFGSRRYSSLWKFPEIGDITSPGNGIQSSGESRTGIQCRNPDGIYPANPPRGI